MSWEDESTVMLRSMIADDGTVQKYTDDQLLILATTAARGVIMDAGQTGFAYDYVVSVEDQTITPDPTDPDSLDDSFLYLIVAKATCILARGAGFKAAGQALRIKSRDDELDLKDGYKARLAVSADSCKEYKELLAGYIIDRRNAGFASGSSGYAVVTPIRAYY